MRPGGPQWDLRRGPPYPADGSGDLRDVEDVSISFISPTGDLSTGDVGPTRRPVASRSTPARRTVGRLRAAGLVVALLAASLASVGPAVADTVVLVRAGDSLSRIADEHGVTLADLMAANGLTDPDLVFMGQALVIPGVGAVSSAPSSIVVVEWGDSLTVIAEDYGVTVAELLASINEKMLIGHFDLWSGDSLPVFRQSILLRGMQGASVEQLEDLVHIAHTECERYYPAFQFVIWGGKTPGEAITAAMLETMGEA